MKYKRAKSASILLCLLLAFHISKSQKIRRDKDLKAGYKLFKKEDYQTASNYYEKVVTKYPQYAGLHFKLAYCYLHTEGKLALALDHFNEASKQVDKIPLNSKEFDRAPFETFYYAAQLNHSLEKLDAANYGYNWYSKYGLNEEFKRNAIHFAKQKSRYRDFVREVYPYQVKKLESASHVRTDESNPFVLFNANDTVNRPSVYNLPVLYSRNEIDLQKNPSAQNNEVMPTWDGYFPVFLANNRKYAIFRKLNKKGDYDLFISQFLARKWQSPTELPINESGSNETHAFMTENEGRIYFISDRNHGMGGFDIWSSTLGRNNKWESPVNLGPRVNTTLNETSLFGVPESGIFYYSSNNPMGFGGYDIYKVTVDDYGVGIPELLQYPVNSGGDDLDFRIEGVKYAVFASNRGLKDFDIYCIDFNVPVKVVHLVGNVPEEAISKNINPHADVVVFEDLVNIIEKIKNLDLETAVKTVETMETRKAIEVVSGLEITQAATIMETMNAEKRTDLLDGMEVEKAVDIVDALSMSTAVDVISTMNPITSIKVVESIEPKKAMTIMNQIDLEKTADLLEGMEVEKAVDFVDEFTTSKAIDVIDKMEPKSAAAIVNQLPEAKTMAIIEGVHVDKAVAVLGGIDEGKAKVIVDRFKETMETEGENSKIIAILKSYFADQVKIKESVIFKTVYFDFNSSELLLLTKKELIVLIDFMNENRDIKIEVVGHTDIIGDWDVNLKISHDRSNEVFRFLRNNKIERERIIFYGKGPASPIAPNNTDENRQKNRRVEVILLQ